MTHGIKLMACMVFFLTIIQNASAEIGQTEELIDFDRPFGFSEPLRVTAFKAARSDKPIFIFLPSTIRVVSEPDSSPAFFLTYHKGETPGAFVSYLTGEVEFGNRDDLDVAIREIRERFPGATFSFPVPASAELGLSAAGMGRKKLVVGHPVIPFRDTISFSVQLPALATRVLLAPRSYQLDVIGIDYTFRLKGLSRTPEGKEVFETRAFRVGSTFPGFCALHPQHVIRVRDSKPGCVHPKYGWRLIYDIQRGLKKHGVNPGPIDGIFGELTERAIKNYQERIELPVDGIPSSELRDKLQ